MEAAREQGDLPLLLHPARVALTLSRQGFGLLLPRGRPLPHVVLPRIGSTIGDFPMALLRHLEAAGVLMVNGSEAVDRARSKFRTLQALAARGVPIPESRYASNERNLASAVRDLGAGPWVMKAAQGRQGRGVFLAEDLPAARRLLRERPPSPGEGLVLQAYIPPEERRRDLRILVLGDRADSAMALRPRRGEFRANIHLHGRAEGIRLSRDMERVAVEAAGAVGLDIAGVDVIENKGGALLVVDVNYSPGFKGLERCTGTDIASRIVAFATSSHKDG